MAPTTVIENYLSPDGVTAASGRVRFKLVHAAYHEGLAAIVPAVPVVAVLGDGSLDPGELSVDLLPCSEFDCPDVLYEVAENIDGVERAAYYVSVPVSMTDVHLGSLERFPRGPKCA